MTMGILGETGLAALGPIPGELPGVPMVASPNHGSRNARLVDLLLWHYTAGPTEAGAINWLCSSASKVSAHFVIGRGGKITQLVPLNRAAWHAGDSAVNARSIGVEVVNVGIVKPDGAGGWLYESGPGWAQWKKDADPKYLTLKYPKGAARTAWWVPYTGAQADAMRELVEKLEQTGYAPATYDMRGHEDTATPEGRKADPGPLFPWELFRGRYNNGHKTTVVEPEGVG